MDFDFARLVLSFLSGALLFQAGSLCQIMTQNPLASPSTLGINALVVCGVLVAHFLLSFFNLPVELGHLSLLLCMVFFFIGLGIVYLQKVKLDFTHIKKIILIGLAINLFVGAIFSFIQFLLLSLGKSFPSELWFGHFREADIEQAPVFFLAFIFFQFYLNKMLISLRFMSVGNHFAYGLGLPVAETQYKALGLSFIMTALVVSYYGVFSFWGIILPHIVRKIPYLERDVKRELFTGSFLSAFTMMFLDLAVYNLTFHGAELPVSMLSSILGPLILIVILVYDHRKNSGHLAKTS